MHIARLVDRLTILVLVIVLFSTKSIINPAFYGDVATKLNVAKSSVKATVLLNMQILTIIGYVGLAATVAYFGYNLYIYFKNKTAKKIIGLFHVVIFALVRILNTTIHI